MNHLKIDRYLILDINDVPLTCGPFKLEQSIQQEYIIQDRGLHLVPIIFSRGSEQLDAGHLYRLDNNYNLTLTHYIYNGCGEMELISLDDDWATLINIYHDHIRSIRATIGLSETGTALIFKLAELYLTTEHKEEFLVRDINTKASLICAGYVLQRIRNEKKLPLEVVNHLSKDIQRLESPLIPATEKQALQDYIHIVKSIPWETEHRSSVSAWDIKAHLDETHDELDRLKNQLAGITRIHYGHGLFPKGVCLVGPPGTGKSTIVKSISESVGSKVIHIPLSGAKDANLLLGFTRTYSKAQPGKIIRGLINTGIMNPIVIFDEIDKAGPDIHNALLHILDPEFNNKFIDSYIDFPIDISKCLFFATANDMRLIPPALKDRLLILELPEYSFAQKHKIIKDFIVPKMMNKLQVKDLEISTEIINKLALCSLREADSKLYLLIAESIFNNFIVNEHQLEIKEKRRTGF